ncbi:break repair meiotic recombinase recruitment factor 1 [Aquila chrysaetos chrysaetos]|uniref:break repair meiotic recombinase recruitment factor 1 n=1 Tax=Aquila chrysaetos chrysaetos TaxID=223781 RepID=UPI001176E176|nr:break repair meiotic recombinase recruitment factor 1 [Aquila chrysaetos chrysaetos]
MGKRKNEQPPGDGKCHVPKTKQSLREDADAKGDDSLDVTGPAQTNDADGKPKSQGQTTHDSTTTNAPTSSANGNGEVAALEQSRAEEHITSPLHQEGRDMDIGGGGKSQEAAAPRAASQPESPQWANSVADEREEDQLVVTAERHRSAGEELDAETPTHRRTGNLGDSPEHGSAPPARGEGTAGREITLPVDAPGQSTGSCLPAEVPEPHCEEGVNHSEPGECQGDANQSRELPQASVVNTEENESGAVSKRAAGGEHQENMSGEQLRATGTNDTVKNAAESCCSLAGGSVSVEVLGVCALSTDPKAEGGTTEPETAGTAGTIIPVSQPQGGNACPWKMLGEADAGQEEAERGETCSPGTSSAPDPAVPAGKDPSGKREGEGLAEERDAEARCSMEHAVSVPRTDARPPAHSSDLPCSGETTGSTPAVMAMPGPAPTGTARPPAASTDSDAGTDPQDGTCSTGEQLSPQPELHCGLEGNSLELLPQQLLPAADWRDSVVPGRELHAAAGQSHAKEMPPLAEGNSPDQPWPRGEEPEGLRPPAHSEDATDVICGLILELSNLNRLAMSAHRGLEALRRPKPRQSRRPGPVPVPPHTGRRWKET